MSNYYRQLAINELFFNGIGISSAIFNHEVRLHNNFEMKLSERHRLIAEKKEPDFIAYLKSKYKPIDCQKIESF